MKATKYQLETAAIVVSIEKLARPEGEDCQWIAGLRSTDLKRPGPAVFARSAQEAGKKLAAGLREMADAIDEGLKEIS